VDGDRTGRATRRGFIPSWGAGSSSSLSPSPAGEASSAARSSNWMSPVFCGTPGEARKTASPLSSATKLSRDSAAPGSRSSTLASLVSAASSWPSLGAVRRKMLNVGLPAVLDDLARGAQDAKARADRAQPVIQAPTGPLEPEGRYRDEVDPPAESACRGWRPVGGHGPLGGAGPERPLHLRPNEAPAAYCPAGRTGRKGTGHQPSAGRREFLGTPCC